MGVGAFGGARSGLRCRTGAGDGAFGGAGLGLTAGAGASDTFSQTVVRGRGDGVGRGVASAPNAGLT